MRRYLVTGGCGFIGSHLVDRLVADGAAVRVLDDLSTGTTAFLPEGVELLKGSVADPTLVREAVAGVDGCFHLAAVASVARCNKAWLASHKINLSSTVALFERASAAERPFPVVYASSAAVYGEQEVMPLGENLPIRPCSPYGADKAACELHARAGASARGLAAVGLRFFNVYGPRQNPDSAYSGVISTFAGRIGRGEPLAMHGDGGQTRDFVFVGDVVQALVGAMRRLEAAGGRPTAEVYNVCSGRATSIKTLAERLMALSGGRVPIAHGPPREGDIRHSVGAPDALLRATGIRPATPLDEGLRRTLRHLGGRPRPGTAHVLPAMQGAPAQAGLKRDKVDGVRPQHGG
jgi:UDP-glucose 4-epimerase